MSMTIAWTVAIAGLLHDIGKVMQRAGIKIDYSNEYDIHYCPSFKGKYSHIHTALTAKFFAGTFTTPNGIIANFANLFSNLQEASKCGAGVAEMASMHHNVNDNSEPFFTIIAEADRIASGFERLENSKDEYEEYSKIIAEDDNKTTLINAKLKNIFSVINLKDLENIADNNTDTYWMLKEISPTIYPDTKPDDLEAKKNYNKILDNIVEEFNNLAENNKKYKYSLENLYGAIMYILEKYTCFIPSTTVTKNGNKFERIPSVISLFDHSKTTSAIATALYKCFEKDIEKNNPNLSDWKKEINKKLKNRDEKNFALINGDFGGIQKFIFGNNGESNKNIAKTLRAKSFFVGIKTNFIVKEICKELSIPESCLIMNTAGKFTLLTHNFNDKIEDFANIKKIKDDFFEISFGQTTFNIAKLNNISANDLNNFGNIMKKLAAQTEIAKLKPYIKNTIFNNYVKELNNKEICPLCGHMAKEKEYCKDCMEHIEKGRELVDIENSIIVLQENGEILLKERINSMNYLQKDTVFKIRETQYSENLVLTKKRLGAYVPYQNDEIKTFEEIAKEAEGSKYLAVFKADVDNLGAIFQNGFGEKSNISKQVTLSRMLEEFFVTRVTYLLETKYKNIYTIFSGGDDLFLIGAWNEIINFAQEITTELNKYTCNKYVHLSAGIYFAKPGTPVLRLAEYAEEYLHIAKSAGKNRLTILNETIAWNEWKKLNEIKIILEELYHDTDKSRHQVYRLFSYINDIEYIEKNKTEKSERMNRALMWRALLHYNLNRHINQVYADRKEEMIKKMATIIEFLTEYKGKMRIPLSEIIYARR